MEDGGDLGTGHLDVLREALDSKGFEVGGDAGMGVVELEAAVDIEGEGVMAMEDKARDVEG